MSNLSSFPVISRIGYLSTEIRKKLTVLGLSQLEINLILEEVLQPNEENVNDDQLCTNHKNGQEGYSLQQNNSRFYNKLAQCLRNREGDCQHYLLSLLRKLQIFLADLEGQQNYYQLILEKQENINLSAQKMELLSHKTTSPSINLIQDSEKFINPHLIQTNNVIQRQLKLQQSLQTLIFKTKMLRSILQRQMSVTSIQSLKRLYVRPFERLNQHENFGFVN